MGGTSIWMSRRGRHSSTTGSPEWNERRSLDHQARCWVLRERLRRTFWKGPGPCPRAVRLDTRPYLENCTVDASIFAESSDSAINLCATERSNRIAKVEICGQVTKGARWMPWHQEPMKDVGGCDKPRGAANRAVIRGCPNGETRLESCPVTLA